METGGEAKGKSGESSLDAVKGAMERDKLSPKIAKEMGDEQFFDLYCRVLESSWSGLFSSPSRTKTTSLSPMQFTHSTRGCTRYAAFAGSALQMYSIKVAEINDALGLQWPLDVYGMVAARDTVDGNRNIIFLCQRNNCQTLTQQDSCLHLTGPSRAIVFTDLVDFDIELKVKGRTQSSEDRVLMNRTFKYNGLFCFRPAPLFNDFCKIELHFEKLEKTVQATIVGVRVTGRRTRPFKHGGQVTCFAKGVSKPGEPEFKLAEPDVPKDKPGLSREVVLQDQVRANQLDGYVDLSRKVVSVELGGTLEVIILEWSESATFISHKVHVFFKAEECKISQETCYLGHSEVEVTVAWSLLARDNLAKEGYVDSDKGRTV